MSPKNSDDEIPNSRTSECDFSWNRVIADEISCSEVDRVGPNLTSVLIKKEIWPQRQRHIEERF